MNYRIQSIIIDKNKYSLPEAQNFILSNNYLLRKIDETEHYFRFRQIAPENLAQLGFNKVVTKQIAPGIKFIIYYQD